ncbi:MAG: hypothetical protein PHR35_03985 [Kiritimatiellae bacterium]|nr:hypothetical protein [Kiritimatiellia bacterium]
MRGQWHGKVPAIVALTVLVTVGVISLDRFLDSLAIGRHAFAYRHVPLPAPGDRAQKQLIETAMKDGSMWPRITAVNNIMDPAALERIALECEDAEVRRAAVQRVSNQRVLARVAMEDTEIWNVRTAVARITDAGVLAVVVSGSPYKEARVAALAKVTDQRLLSRVATEEDDDELRGKALESLTDQSALARVAMGDRVLRLRLNAIGRLTNQWALARIALEDGEVRMRKDAIAKINDRDVLIRVARTDQVLSNRDAAKARLNRVTGESVRRLPAALPASAKPVAGAEGMHNSDVASEPAATEAQADGAAAEEAGADIVSLIAGGQVEVRANGRAIDTVTVAVRRLTADALAVSVPVGSFFVSSRASAQNMVATSASSITLLDDDWHDLSVAVACANRPLAIPGANDSFTIVRSPHQAELELLMPVLERAQADYGTRQAAVWIVTDDATYAELGTLVTSSTYSPTQRRVIGAKEAARALQLCAEAGIDIDCKRIGSDKPVLLQDLGDSDLATWLDAMLFSTPANKGRSDGAIREAERFRGYLAAAERGDAYARRMVGVRYLFGKGVSKDAVAAYGWIALAMSAGDAQAASLLQAIERRLSQEELRLAQNWVQRRQKVEPAPSGGTQAVTEPRPLPPAASVPPVSVKGTIKRDGRYVALLSNGTIVCSNDVFTTAGMGEPIHWRVTSVTADGAKFVQVNQPQAP